MPTSVTCALVVGWPLPARTDGWLGSGGSFPSPGCNQAGLGKRPGVRGTKKLTLGETSGWGYSTYIMG